MCRIITLFMFFCKFGFSEIYCNAESILIGEVITQGGNILANASLMWYNIYKQNVWR